MVTAAGRNQKFKKLKLPKICPCPKYAFKNSFDRLVKGALD